MPQPEPFLYLTTRGRRTGQPREIEIWFTELEGRYYCIAEYDTSHWLANIRAHSAVRWRVGAQQFSGTARVLYPARDRYAWLMVQQLSRSKYGWGDGTVVELQPEEP